VGHGAVRGPPSESVVEGPLAGIVGGDALARASDSPSMPTGTRTTTLRRIINTYGYCRLVSGWHCGPVVGSPSADGRGYHRQLWPAMAPPPQAQTVADRRFGLPPVNPRIDVQQGTASRPVPYGTLRYLSYRVSLAVRYLTVTLYIGYPWPYGTLQYLIYRVTHGRTVPYRYLIYRPNHGRTVPYRYLMYRPVHCRTPSSTPSVHHLPYTVRTPSVLYLPYSLRTPSVHCATRRTPTDCTPAVHCLLPSDVVHLRTF